MGRRDLEGQMKEVLGKSALKNGVKREEAEQGISETWKYICENPDPSIRELGLSMMENGNPLPPEKITLYLTILTHLCNSSPLINEADPVKRVRAALEKIVKLHQTGTI